MPRLPILSRETFYDTNPDGSLRLLDWNLVNTSLGAMVEPRQVGGPDGGRIRPIDLIDAGITRLVPLQEDVFFRHFGVHGRQLPVNFAR